MKRISCSSRKDLRTSVLKTISGALLKRRLAFFSIKRNMGGKGKCLLKDNPFFYPQKGCIFDQSKRLVSKKENILKCLEDEGPKANSSETAIVCCVFLRISAWSLLLFFRLASGLYFSFLSILANAEHPAL